MLCKCKGRAVDQVAYHAHQLALHATLARLTCTTLACLGSGAAISCSSSCAAVSLACLGSGTAADATSCATASCGVRGRGRGVLSSAGVRAGETVSAEDSREVLHDSK